MCYSIPFRRGRFYCFLISRQFTSAIGTPAFEQDWLLDPTGNWGEFDEKTSGSATLEQKRYHNEANEIAGNSGDPLTLQSGGAGTNWADVMHDKAGNMTAFPRPKALGSSYTAEYDAWNRLVKVKSGGSTVQANQYDGLHRRVVRDETGGSGVVRHFYYNNEWQCLEERVSGSMDRQYVWRPHYIDALAVTYDNSSTKHFYLYDALFSVVGAVSNAGTVVERYHYAPYSAVKVLDEDFSPDAAGGDGMSDIDNEFLYTGRRLDPETGLQYSRYRYYHPQLGRWLTRDPIGYEGSQWNLYEYVNSDPAALRDPKGTMPMPVTQQEIDDCWRCYWNKLGWWEDQGDLARSSRCHCLTWLMKEQQRTDKAWMDELPD